MDAATVIGLIAAACTTLSFYPQLRKLWLTGSARDLSLVMFLILTAGVMLWLTYGVLKNDIVIIFGNAVSVLLLAGILFFKIREMVQGSTGLAPHARGGTSHARGTRSAAGS